MSTLKRDLQKCSSSSGFLLFNDIKSKYSKNSEKEEIEYEVVELDHVYETSDDTDFKIETIDNFPLPFNEFYVVNISLTDEEIKHIEYSTRVQQSSNLWCEYGKEKKEKLTASSNFYIAAVNKVEPSTKIKSLFYSVKTTSMKHGIANESVVLTEYVSLVTTKSVIVNLVQPGLILPKWHPFLGASLDSTVTNVNNVETWGVEISPSSKLDRSINDVLKDKKFYLEKGNEKIQLKMSHKYFYQIQGQMFTTQLKESRVCCLFRKKCTTAC